MKIHKISAAPMHLMHGTNSEYLESIQKEGLRTPYLTDVEEIAREYAEVTTGRGEPIILLVKISDQSKLQPDRPSLQEPVGYNGMTGKQMDEMVGQIKNHDDWKQTFHVTRTVRYNGTIPPNDISVA